MINTLFICTGNSARSILAEALLNKLGHGRFEAFSAGSHPGGRVNPFAIELLEKNGYPTGGLRSKSWDEFEGPAAPRIDLVFTVCDSAGAESCPVWPGAPITAHWGIPDPAAMQGSDEEKRRAFVTAFTTLQRRISLLVALPIEKIERSSLRHELAEIGRVADGRPIAAIDRR